MSSSSDIEKLFDHFGGDATAYQEIGRENDARTARTRWPLLVTLDLSQPTIPEIGQRREAGAQPPVSAAPAVDREDTTPRDAASVTRAKAPLFTRSHRRDIPPVVVAAPKPAAPSGASRFGALGGDAESAAQATAVAPMNNPVANQAARNTPVPPVPSFAPATSATPVAGSPFNSPFRTPVMPTAPAAPAPAAQAAQTAYATPAAPAAAAVPGWAHAPAPTAPAQAFAAALSTPAKASAAPRGYAGFMQPTQPAPAAPAPQSTQSTQPTQPTSILGKLFAAPTPAAPQQSAPTAAHISEPAPLQSVFDRLRGTSAPAQAPTATAPAAAPGVPPSWLVNGPRRS